MSEPEAAVSMRRRLSAVWIVPAVAMLLGLWLVVDTYLSRGPVVEIRFPTAEGIEEDTTPVKARNVEVGVVEEVALNDDLSGVTVTARLSADSARLLREDTRFWVVRPRVTTGGVSGLGTIVSGAYIEIAPGIGKEVDRRAFEGLDHPPPTPAGTPGVRLNLVSETSGSLGVGDPVLYRGYAVGRVETTRLDVDAKEVRYSIFIDAPYDALVTTGTRFWDASGISAELTADGATVNLASLESLVTGGVAFDLPKSSAPGGPVSSDDTFQLFPDRTSIDEQPHRYFKEYVVSFDQSVRGLNPRAPVTFRGLTVGRVQRIMVGEGTAATLSDGRSAEIPVLIRIEPGRFELSDTPAGVEKLENAMARAIDNGLRATLESGSLLTGSLYVNLDFFGAEPPGRPGEFAGRPTIPTTSAGLGRLQQQVSRLVAKLDALPLEQTLSRAQSTLSEIEGASRELETLLADDELRGLPERLERSLDELDATLAAYSADSGLPEQISRAVGELDRTLESIRATAEKLERDPNAVIFPSRHPKDPLPGAGTP